MGRRRWQWGEGDGEVGNREGAIGRGQQGGEMGKGDFTGGYIKILGWTYGMLGWNEVTEFSDFVHPCNAGYPS